MAIAMPSSTSMAIPECDKGETSISNDNDNVCEDSPLCPSSYPSKTFSASNIRVSHQQIEAEEKSGVNGLQLLPLQRYHAQTRKRKDARSRIRVGEGTETNTSLLGKTHKVIHDIPSLDYIYENQSLFQITKSSQVLLEEYHTLKTSYNKTYASDPSAEISKEQKEFDKQLILLKADRLRSKIRAECRASLPLSVEETLKILYCDSHICVVDKPSGVLSVPGHRRNPSLAGLVYDIIDPSSYDTESSIDNIDQTVVHRLDMATSGIIVYALSKEALQRLHITFRDRTIQKTYQALVEGHVFLSKVEMDGHLQGTSFSTFRCGTAIEGEIDVALERDPDNPPYMRIAQTRPDPTISGNDTGDNDGKKHKFWREAPKPSKTSWSVLSYEFDSHGKPVTRLELRPHTGRTHQLRVHTSQVLGAPIIGDEIYGNGDGMAPLCLHARQLCLQHPVSGAAMIFEADPPF